MESIVSSKKEANLNRKIKNELTIDINQKTFNS